MEISTDVLSQRSADEHPVYYTHSIVTTGIGEIGETTVVLVHITMGPVRDELRMTAINTRIMAQALLESADKVDGLRPMDGYPQND